MKREQIIEILEAALGIRFEHDVKSGIIHMHITGINNVPDLLEQQPGVSESKKMITAYYKDVVKALEGNKFMPALKPDVWCDEYFAQSHHAPEISENDIERAVEEIICDKLSNEDRVVPEHYVRATLEWLKLNNK